MKWRKLKSILRCRVTIFLLLGWGALSAVGYMGKDNIYKDYRQDIRKEPYFVMVFEGTRDGVYPWSTEGEGLIPKSWKEPFTADNSQEQSGQPQVQETKQPETPETGGAQTGEAQAKTEEGQTEQTQPEPSQTEAATEQAPLEKEFIAVDESYFNDAVFIGDSRTVGLRDYGGLNSTDFYAALGLNVYDMWTEKYCEVDGVKTTLEEALKAKQYKKVYFQIGINEMGRGTIDGFMEKYEEAVSKFKELQPDAIIYVQGIMGVAKAKSDSDAIFNNEGIRLRNERIAQLADNRTVFYIDVNEVVCDEEGNLKEELTFDNLHLYGSKYNIWVDFLKTKGIEL